MALIPPKQDLFARLAAKREENAVEANFPSYHFEECLFVISPSTAISVGYVMKSVVLKGDAIPTIFDKLESLSDSDKRAMIIAVATSMAMLAVISIILVIVFVVIKPCLVGCSEYWMLDDYRRNCSVIDEKCEKQIDKPPSNCSGLAVYYLYTCSESTFQRIDCYGLTATNYMTITYTYTKAASMTTPDSSFTNSTTIDNGRNRKGKSDVCSCRCHRVMTVLIVARRKNIESLESAGTSKYMTEPPKDYFYSICMDNTLNVFASLAVISNSGDSNDKQEIKPKTGRTAQLRPIRFFRIT
ncbi:hypothetical protein LSH36_1244g00019 [Paralvinella palmiformis]|uniref:Uncharacterized protein n=1 Tax=Paralvinella palmiformis TaxID=53620 RepID=A0AAD9MP01_9ANNE|nr:hypothetical protein LSH36_1244g00019 [Paralvinella palmiformis]